MSESKIAATAAPDDRRLAWYMGGQASWFASLGLQFVLFPWLASFVLGLAPELVGIAQMSLMAPALLFMLLGGATAEQADGRKLLIALHVMAALPPLGLGLAIATDSLSFSQMIVYGLAMGTIGAFAMPTRDNLLTRISGADIQRSVTMATGFQFGFQLIGMLIAASGRFLAAAPLLFLQSAIMLFGAFAAWRLPSFPPTTARSGLADKAGEIVEGLKEVYASPVLWPVIASMFAIGLFYVSTMMVGLPILVRDGYGFATQDGAFALALINICFWGGTIAATMALLKIGGVTRWGRLMMMCMAAGVPVLALMAVPGPFWLLCLLCAAWGMGAGGTMAMSRTIVQTKAPATHRARILSIYQLGFAGGGPVGSLVIGYLIAGLGPRVALLVPAAAMTVTLIWLMGRSDIWRITQDTPAERVG